ncbi:MAG: DUF6531 domain-containing protein, partial [Gammaproteobacteria bacterium]
MPLRKSYLPLQITCAMLIFISISTYANSPTITYQAPVNMFNDAPYAGVYCMPYQYSNLWSAEASATPCMELAAGSPPPVTETWISDWIMQGMGTGSQFVRDYDQYCNIYFCGEGLVVINLECYYPNTVSPNYPGWCLTPFQTLECSPFVFDPTKGCVAPAEGKPCNKECAGDPINIGTGNTYEETTDYRGSGLFPLVFSRAYNSAFANESYSPDFASTNENMGQGWSTNTGAHLFINDYTPQILITPCIINGTEYFCPPTYFPSYTIELTVWHADGGQDQFNYQVVNNVVPTPGTPLNAEPGSAGELTFVNLPAPMMGTGYEYLRNDGYTEFYDLNGTLLVVEDPHGLTQIYAYQYTNGVLSGMTVTDPFGRTMQFTYNSNNQITTMTNPAGGVYTYSYDTNGNLIKVTYPDNSTIQYQYTNATYKNALTGVIDENGNTYATWTYDSQGRAISTLQGS